MGIGLDLFSAASAEGAWTVGELTRRARTILEAGLEQLWVHGEVSGIKQYQSGHWYFTLRDKTAQVRCVMWAKHNQRLPTAPADGMKVYVFGRPTIYDAKGEFQLNVVELLSTEAGGLWQVAFEKAKAALARDGLLDPARKRPLPAYAQRIAVITSADSAALRDIMVVVGRRWPLAQILVLPARVQGEGAVAELRAAFALLDRLRGVDVAIVGRGGGSKEDLWAFNSEHVARAVAAAPVPVISAVGHETDVTLCDLVADWRAATPSAAAEAATPDQAEVLDEVAHLGTRLARGLVSRVELASQRLERSREQLSDSMSLRLERLRLQLGAAGGRLDALSPLKILERGYSVARDARGQVLRRVAQFPAGTTFRLRVSDGEVPARAAES